MAVEDKIRWDKKHAQDLMPHNPIEFVKTFAPLAPKKRALDIACGNGRHSRYLVSLGFEVDALDISSVAISNLLNIPNIYPKEVDFDTYRLPKQRYALIVQTYFLHRPLLAMVPSALEKGGYFLLETFVHHEKNQRKASNPSFRLEQGELKRVFEKKKGCEIVHIKEYFDKDYMGYRCMKAQFVLKKII